MTPEEFTNSLCKAIKTHVANQKVTHPHDIMCAVFSVVEGVYELTSELPGNCWNLTKEQS